MTSYFHNRSQYVSFQDTESVTMEQSIGVIQGSRLGPLLFDIYSNDFNKLCSDDENILYADDACLVYVGENIEELVAHVNQRLRIIDDWCNSNKLFLNRDKCEYMIVTNRATLSTNDILIGNDKINEAKTFKYLGVHIDNNCKFQTHINTLKGKLSQLCGMTYRLRNRIDLKAAKKIYYAFAYSVISYCIATWGGTLLCTHRADALFRLQKKIVSNLFSRFYPISEDIFKQTEILKIQDIYRMKVALYMYKVIAHGEYPTLQNNLYLVHPQHSYDTRSSASLTLPFPRVEVIRMNFRYQFVNVWNTIPDEIKCLQTVKAFKRSLSNLYLNTYNI